MSFFHNLLQALEDSKNLCLSQWPVEDLRRKCLLNIYNLVDHSFPSHFPFKQKWCFTKEKIIQTVSFWDNHLTDVHCQSTLCVFRRSSQVIKESCIQGLRYKKLIFLWVQKRHSFFFFLWVCEGENIVQYLYNLSATVFQVLICTEASNTHHSRYQNSEEGK